MEIDESSCLVVMGQEHLPYYLLDKLYRIIGEKSKAKILKLFKNWIEDYNNVALHSGLGMKSPVEYRKLRDQAVYLKWVTSSLKSERMISD